MNVQQKGRIALVLIAFLTVLPVDADNYVGYGISLYGETQIRPRLYSFCIYQPRCSEGWYAALRLDRHL